MGCVYKLTSPSGKSYIGITMFDVEKRFREHVLYARKNIQRSALHAALNKYGSETFVSELLCEADEWRVLCELEKAAISEHGTYAPNGYNMTSGGDGVPGTTPEVKARHRENTATGTKEAWKSNVEFRERRAATFATTEFKAKHSEATSVANKKRYANQTTLQVLRMSRARPAYKARVSAAVRRLWANPEYRAKQVSNRLLHPPRSEASKRAQGDRMRLLIAARKEAGTYWHCKQEQS